MDTTTPLPTAFAARIDTCDDPVDVVCLLALRAFLDGSQPAARTARLQRVRAEAALVPPGLEPVRQAVDLRVRAHVAEGPGWTLVAKAWDDGNGVVTVTAVTDELAGEVLEAATAGAEAPPPATEDEVDVRFWHLGRHGAHGTDRSIAVPAWAEIEANYEAAAAAAIGRLMAMEAAPPTGRLLLLHGPPGTGKTTVLRALARAWAPWCRVHHVLDPERMFGAAGYLLDVLAHGGDDAPWKLLVLEDCDELIAPDAKAGTGQSLARLLNLTDGMVGQGVRAMVCITTNERLGALHPAVTRPGRCLAEVEVGPLPGPAARAWLGRELPGGATSATLAQLLAWRDASGPVSSVEPEVVVGTYL
jgi:hypothetical protein